MIALVTSVQVKPEVDIMEEGKRLWLDELLPAFKQQKGYRGITLLSLDRNDHSQSAVLWETAEDAEAALSSAEIQRIAGKFGPLMIAEPTRKIHPITVDERA